ncbi:amidohydrolase family protein, partial [Mycobacterium sp. 852002-10029_SCH5224772]|uniref:amidohydrolase family protein n=1 Tax=Mycobacterium sp. 852002-10029_SCH5224772 TaxID=1834083 RepID=UPI003515EAD8
MAVRDGVIAWLGSDAVGRAMFPDADVEDVDAGFVAPGFVDSHIHLTSTGLTLSGLDLRAARSRAHCMQLVTDYAAAHPDQPVWGHGWDETSWPDNAPPNTSDLDAVIGDRPAYLARVDVHSALASTGLRRLVAELPGAAGFSAERPLVGDAPPQGGAPPPARGAPPPTPPAPPPAPPPRGPA